MPTEAPASKRSPPRKNSHRLPMGEVVDDLRCRRRCLDSREN